MKDIRLAMVCSVTMTLFSATLQAQDTIKANIGDSVQVAFRTVESHELTGGVAYVDVPQLLDKNYFTYSLSEMEAFAAGFHGNLWGNNSFLVLVDGVPRDAGSVMPTEIEQVTFLKGVAAVALYGSRAAKGVVMITTKRGRAAEQTVEVRANAGLHTVRRYPQYLGSAEYMTLYNEARLNDGLGALYSAEDIYHHAAGANPYRYPNVDYYSPEYLKNTYNRYDATVEIAGGNQRAAYYTNFGYWSEGTLLNFGQAADNKNERFNIRGNVDMNINQFIDAKVDAAAIFYNGKGVNTDYWNGAATLRPHRFAPLIPISMIEADDEESMRLVGLSSNLIDGRYLLGGTQLDQTNPFADIYAGGSNTYTSRQFQFNTAVDFDLRNVLPGLSFSSMFGMDYATSYNQSFNHEYAVYEPVWNNYAGDDLIGSLTRYGQDASSRTQNVSNSAFRQTIAASGQLNYRRQFDSRHNVSATLLAGGFQQTTSGVYHKTSNANLGLHAGYNYQGTYYAEFNGALVHSARLPERNRQAFNPTATIGWRISNEPFIAGSSAIDNLMVSVSGGILHTDLDIADYYLYEAIYANAGDEGGAWYGWRDMSAGERTTDSRRGANPNLTFPKREEVSVNLNASFFNQLVSFNASWFASRMKGLVVQNGNLFPSYFTTGWPVSSFIPYVNYDEDERSGFDFDLQLNKKVGNADLSLGLTGTYYKAIATRRADIFEDSYQNRIGRELDAIWGLQAEGFFSSVEEIENSPTQAFGQVRPGDIKYKDQNNDGVINDQDAVYLGRGGWFGAPFTAGIHLTAKYRNLTVFVLGMARTGAYALRDNSYFWIAGENKYSEVVRGRWTPETSGQATYPRLTTLNGNNNFRSSDFWLYSTDRFDLARVQVSYTLPKRIIGDGFFNELGVYINGANLLTISPNRKIMELNIGSAPQTRFFNVGAKVLF
ncbi:TonB-linked outer membrane protein, SusC/RagA family [Parapedobacter luteus]|uniref:TonB-linked outer membrane protein, SusC/RagA family n=1 Tax=Parapedobacter luteus TaxID=623280 RepID=A0A1T5BEC5_9SPHI|nr:SusC/RagA family TonB-linked outer membrane protein [Parapedobacter luteus]SKB45641.1 TonB-linked outer membrane protein, SusC/RagA family [Parapedobacter luteus]